MRMRMCGRVCAIIVVECTCIIMQPGIECLGVSVCVSVCVCVCVCVCERERVCV